MHSLKRMTFPMRWHSTVQSKVSVRSVISAMDISRLSQDVLIVILQKVADMIPKWDLLRLRLVCRNFRNAISEVSVPIILTEEPNRDVRIVLRVVFRVFSYLQVIL